MRFRTFGCGGASFPSSPRGCPHSLEGMNTGRVDLPEGKDGSCRQRGVKQTQKQEGRAPSSELPGHPTLRR